MEEIKYIICISCFCCLFSEFSGIMQGLAWDFKKENGFDEKGYRKYRSARLKPFDCAKCLSFWMGLFVFLLHGDGILAIFYASICSVLSIYIVRYAK